MTATIFFGFLNGYTPGWADLLLTRAGRPLPDPVERIDISLDLASLFAPERHQYNATLMLAGLLRHLPEPGARIVGITDVDLFIPVLTFVFGQAQLNGPGAVISTYRLRNELYGLPANEDVLLERAVKEVVHELGHAFGLVHCRQPTCVMRAATYVEDVDLKDAEFCRECRLAIGDGGRA